MLLHDSGINFASWFSKDVSCKSVFSRWPKSVLTQCACSFEILVGSIWNKNISTTIVLSVCPRAFKSRRTFNKFETYLSLLSKFSLWTLKREKVPHIKVHFIQQACEIEEWIVFWSCLVRYLRLDMWLSKVKDKFQSYSKINKSEFHFSTTQGHITF